MTCVRSYVMHMAMTNVIFLFVVGALGFKHIWSQIYICKSWNMALIVVMLLLNHISSYIIHLFFIFSFLHLNFSSPYSQKKIFFSLSVHTYTYISSNLSPFFLSLHLPTTLYLLLHFLLLSFVLIFLLPILFSINSISFFQFNPYFSYRKLWVLFLSLSLSLSLWIFVISYNSN